MTFDKQQDDKFVQQNDIRPLDDDALGHVTGGADLFDIFKFVVNTVNTVLRMANGRPQV